MRSPYTYVDLIPELFAISEYIRHVREDCDHKLGLLGAPCTVRVPGTVVRVVNAYSATSENVPVSFVMSVDYALKSIVA